MAVVGGPARAATRVCVPLAVLASAGCTTFQKQAPNVTIVPARIAVLPALTLAYEVDSNDNHKPLDDWANAMAAFLKPEVDRWVVGTGGHVFAEQGAKVPYAYERFRKWTATSLAEIARRRHTGPTDYPQSGDERSSVDEWGFEENLSWLKELVDADFVLVTMFRDMRQTPGRDLAKFGVHTHFLEFGAACLVDVKSARMVWCNTRADAWQDLSLIGNAQIAVADLLTDLYPHEAARLKAESPPIPRAFSPGSPARPSASPAAPPASRGD